MRWRLSASAACALVAAVLAAAQVLVAHRLGVNDWTVRGGSYAEYVDWDHPLTRSTWYPAASTLIASMITHRLFRRAPWSWRWLPPAAWLGSCLTAGPLLYGLASAAPEAGIGSGPSAAVRAVAVGGVIGLVAAMVALRRREAGAGLVTYILWVSLLEFARPWWWDRAPAFDPMLTEEVWAGGSGDRVVRASFLEAGGITAGLIGPVVVSGVVAVWAAARYGRRRSGVIAGVAGPLLLCSVYLTIDPGWGDQDSVQAALCWYAFLAVPIGLCSATIAATLAGAVARRVGADARRTR
ncbi:hypothetical protein [Streptosporangium pseudovulgare]|uniref:hypothetical protein n=1 Tax=Streptosporangium pseudovulgare TaxID=35765 RepID=UPI00167182C1|nr:hypothetical protein [Streptosporangium pseudovulgare]